MKEKVKEIKIEQLSIFNDRGDKESVQVPSLGIPSIGTLKSSKLVMPKSKIISSDIKLKKERTDRL